MLALPVLLCSAIIRWPCKVGEPGGGDMPQVPPGLGLPTQHNRLRPAMGPSRADRVCGLRALGHHGADVSPSRQVRGMKGA